MSCPVCEENLSMGDYGKDDQKYGESTFCSKECMIKHVQTTSKELEKEIYWLQRDLEKKK